ncbi:hypothetical protein J5N97_026857 [Dioscorea zingiberensis]|uniref:Uncharacterized protein n=1 Tax=Dioscorea zingiberensis TaxID=325984 RepID=A0A9D5H730_9LILI|nr:hypothetical protein J5N97_026857 [Dioscorea zingiberensis]
MGKNESMGARRKEAKRSRRRVAKGLAAAVVEYLISDSYFYAPLIDPMPANPSPPDDKIRSPPPNPKDGVPVVHLQKLLVK